uniref:Uncharacterized protein n=1 Tax=Aegilops tauschii TaxID=37682 RepID=M8BUK4_AEGTA
MSACLMCLEAQHRLAFERRHGSDTFPYHIPAETAEDLLKDGANEDEVLEEIQRNGGADAWPDQEGWERRCKLQIKSWDTFDLERLPSASGLARMIRAEGPLVGCLDVVLSDYYAHGWEKRVYGGGSGKEDAESHALVCMEYRFDGDDIRVVDNHESDGPVRWISRTAFTSFTQIKVEPLDASALFISKEVSWWRRLVRRLWREETFWWRQRHRLSKVWKKKKKSS